MFTVVSGLTLGLLSVSQANRWLSQRLCWLQVKQLLDLSAHTHVWSSSMSSQTSDTPTTKTQVPEGNKTFYFSATLMSVWLTDARTLGAHRYFHCTSERSLPLPVVHRCERRLTWHGRRVVQELRATFCCVGISAVPLCECCSGHHGASRGWWQRVFVSVAGQ